MRFVLVAALIVGAAPALAQTAASAPAPASASAPPAKLPSSPAKKQLVARLLQLQQPLIEGIARQIVERPAMQLMQAASTALQTQVPPEKREATAKLVDADLRQYVDEATPVLRERAIALAPASYGAALEDRFTEAELKQWLAWAESPLSKKLQSAGPELQNEFVQKLIPEASSLLDPKLQALQQKVRTTLNNASGAGAAAAPTTAASGTPRPAAPARPASK